MALIDLATDVLVIGMTALVLFSINPWLVVVTLLPLPFIAWMIHLVRNRLRYGFEQIDRVWSEVTSVLADTIPGVRVVELTGVADWIWQLEPGRIAGPARAFLDGTNG